MKVIYLNPIGATNPHLFHQFKGVFEETDNPYEARYCFMELQSGTVSYEQNILDVVKEKNIPLVVFDNREFGGTSNEKWHPIELNPAIYFVRNMMKEQLYPKNVFPYDWPYFPECDFVPTTKEELNSRPYDCCLISVESPARRNVVDAILKDGRLKLHYKFLDHTKRMPYNQWLGEHRKAKLYI